MEFCVVKYISLAAQLNYWQMLNEYYWSVIIQTPVIWPVLFPLA